MSPSPPPAPEQTDAPPLPPGTPPQITERDDPADPAGEPTPPVEEEGTTDADAPEADTVEEGEEKEDGGAVEGKAAPDPGVHKGADGWTAVWSAEANAYYFWHAEKNLTTWENPLTDSTDDPAASTSSAAPGSSRELVDYGGIDPELAYLDPSLSRSSTSGSAAPAFQARFNSRTGRFQGDPTMTPDRISEFSRGERQQEVFYNTQAWQSSLGGKGVKRSAEEEEGGKRKKVTAKDVARFKANKEEKKRKAMGWLRE